MKYIFVLLILCYSITCVQGDCFDMQRNGGEAGVDCGGPDCFQRCEVGSPCTDDLDCESSLCIDKVCEGDTQSKYYASGGTNPPEIPQNSTDTPSSILALGMAMALFISCVGVYSIVNYHRQSQVTLYSTVDNYNMYETDNEHNDDKEIELADV